ncbi:unnamed protein product [Sympodiomycopsis kandeliae]
MLGGGSSTYTWSQADLEDLAPTPQQSHTSNSAQVRLETGDDAASSSHQASAVPATRGEGNGMSATTPARQLSSSSTSTSSSSSAANPWLRRTSTLVEDSDPVVLSRSNRSSSLSRSASRSSNPWPDRAEEASLKLAMPSNATLSSEPASSPGPATGAWPASPNSASASEFFFRSDRRPGSNSWKPEHMYTSHDSQRYPGSSSLYRSSSASPGQPLPSMAAFPHLSSMQINGHSRFDDPSILSSSPGRFEEYGSSPRGLETMHEDVEHHHQPQLHRMHSNQFHPLQSPHVDQHHRMRSSSSAAALGFIYPTQQGSPDSLHYASSPASAGVLHSPSRFGPWNVQDSSSRNFDNADGGETARQSPQSPVGRRGLPATSPPPAISNFSPFQRDLATAEAGAGGFAFGAGTESRRHSIAASSAIHPVRSGHVPTTASGQRRAVGFELVGGESTVRNGSLNHTDATATPRVGPADGQNKSMNSSSALTDDDLAADLGHLDAELDKIKADQQQREHETHRSAISVRVPSSNAATTGVHAASMPPLFGDNISAKNFSESDWHAVLSPRSPADSNASSSPWRDQQLLNRLQQQVHTKAYIPSKSRSASVGPRGNDADHIDGLASEREGINGEKTSASASKLSPTAKSFTANADVMLNSPREQYLQQQQGDHGFRPPGPAFPMSSLKAPSTAGVMHSGVTALGMGHQPQISHPSSVITSTGLGFEDGIVHGAGLGDSSLQTPMAARSGPPILGELNEFALNSLATLGPLPPSVGGGGGAQDGPSALQDLGRGIPLAELPSDTPLYIVGFKQGRTDLFFKSLSLDQPSADTIQCDDLVIVEADRGKDVGRVVNDALTVEQVRVFLSSTDMSLHHPLGSRAATAARNINPKRLYSKATSTDLSMLLTKSLDEEKALDLCIQKVQQRGLPMHVLAAELQWDRRKLTFYYTAISRVDFRALVAELFKIFKMRIWMCQIATSTSSNSGNVNNGPPTSVPGPSAMPPSMVRFSGHATGGHPSPPISANAKHPLYFSHAPPHAPPSVHHHHQQQHYLAQGQSMR